MKADSYCYTFLQSMIDKQKEKGNEIDYILVNSVIYERLFSENNLEVGENCAMFGEIEVEQSEDNCPSIVVNVKEKEQAKEEQTKETNETKR